MVIIACNCVDPNTLCNNVGNLCKPLRKRLRAFWQPAERVPEKSQRLQRFFEPKWQFENFRGIFTHGTSWIGKNVCNLCNLCEASSEGVKIRRGFAEVCLGVANLCGDLPRHSICPCRQKDSQLHKYAIVVNNYA